MQNVDNLMNMIAEHVEQGPRETFFTTLDMTYAFREGGAERRDIKTLQLPNYWRQSNWNLHICDWILRPHHHADRSSKNHITNTFTFIDDNLIVIRGTEDEHVKKVKEIMKRLDEAKINLRLDKCTFAAKNIEWVGYQLSQQGGAPINSKVQGNSERLKTAQIFSRGRKIVISIQNTTEER